MKKNEFPEFSTLYAKLKPFYQKMKRGRAQENLIFQNCLRASFVKAYEFNVLANSSTNNVSAFFLTPALTSICEDLILLRYLSSLYESSIDNIIYVQMKNEL